MRIQFHKPLLLMIPMLIGFHTILAQDSAKKKTRNQCGRHGQKGKT
jgi:hypothetical protein